MQKSIYKIVSEGYPIQLKYDTTFTVLPQKWFFVQWFYNSQVREPANQEWLLVNQFNAPKFRYKLTWFESECVDCGFISINNTGYCVICNSG